ncbi:PDR/VanB family oxidoreductase [Nakamurella sp.]|uniref:PDR/VanB family oxidoreductase n=1 Tax=Nakamurella sp. TaxID=1869182 RepID=UPI003B3B82CD
MAADTQPSWQPGRVVETGLVADRIRRITIARPPTGRAQPGAHLDVQVRLADRADTRSYSIVESNPDGSLLTLSVLLSPTSRGGSRFMHDLRVGDTLPTTQPLQNFPLQVGAERYVLVAGGIGITALLAMATALRSRRADYTFVYVARSRHAAAYLDEVAAEHGDRLVVHLDDEGDPLDVAALIADVAAGRRAHTTELYMCGPIRLMDAIRREWRVAELPTHHLRYETFGNSGWFEPEEFVVRIPRLGLEATVGPDRTILEALTDAGAELMFDCRKGECGLCVVSVLDVDGVIDHRDVFLSDRQRGLGTQLCSCVSRTASGRTASCPPRPAGAPPVVTIDVP